MRVLVACEFSGRVREAFRLYGHEAWSCDLLPADDESPYHIMGDVVPLIYDPNETRYDQATGKWDRKPWDLLIAFPPCTHLCVSGARWFKDKRQEQQEALDFIRLLLDAPIDHIALENPIGVISTKIRKPDQIIQPWQFGHGETKATCLWLKGLPKLVPTDIVGGRASRVHHEPPSADRWRKRSITYQGIANAMAEQWS